MNVTFFLIIVTHKTNNMAQQTVSKMERVQTAVEWLVEQLVELDKQLDGRRKSDDSTVVKLNTTRIYEQAKQIEKEQIMKAYKDYHNLGHIYGLETEQYYNETYIDK